MDVCIHCEATCARSVIPSQVDARKLGTVPILRDLVVFFEYGGKVLCVLLPHIFDAEIVDD